MEQEPIKNTEKRYTSEVPFTIGQEVVVKRNEKNGQPARLEGGWKVNSFDEETGNYEVSFYDKEADEFLQKIISATDLTSFQPTQEPEALSEPTTADYANFAPQPEIFKKPLASESKPELITGVPDFAIEAAHSTIDWEPVPINEAVEDLAELATEQVVADPSDSDATDNSLEQEVIPESKLLEADIQTLLANTESESERIGIWQYANAINDTEERSALARISPATKERGVHLQYKEVATKLREARIKEGLL